MYIYIDIIYIIYIYTYRGGASGRAGRRQGGEAGADDTRGASKLVLLKY